MNEQWTKEIPTEPGWYPLVEKGTMRFKGVVHIFEDPKGTVVAEYNRVRF